MFVSVTLLYIQCITYSIIVYHHHKNLVISGLHGYCIFISFILLCVQTFTSQLQHKPKSKLFIST